MQLNKEPGVSTNQLGNNDPVIQLMQKYEIEMTRDNYLYYAFMGDVPEELGAEIEDELPSQFQLQNG